MSKSIKLADYPDYRKSINPFRNELIRSLGDNLFQYKTKEQIIYNSLKIIYPLNKNIKDNSVSIEKTCEKVFKHFGIAKIAIATVRKLTDDFEEIKNEEQVQNSITFSDRFFEEILSLKTIPKENYTTLRQNTEFHLGLINKNLNYYNSLPFIKEYIISEKKPTSHIEKTQLEFYKRCLDEQNKIIDYLLDGIKKRTIEKSTKKIFDFEYFTYFKDYPYKSALSYNSALFNHNRISSVEHRFYGFKDTNVDSLEKLYNIDKIKFYKQYFKIISKNTIFQRIEYYISIVPLSISRKKVIDELFYLFKAKKYISFYIIALSQIEGIFNEMLEYINSKKINTKSLFYKVDSLRDFHHLSESYFDYFQYIIPQLRNRFMHGGIDDRIMDPVSSYDLLTDINFLLNIFYELESPFVQINKLIKPQLFYFTTIEHIYLFFDIVDRIKPDQKKLIKNELDNYIQRFLIENLELESILHDVKENLPRKIMMIKEEIESKIKIDIETTTIVNIKSAILDKINLKRHLSYFENQIAFILHCDYYYKNYKKNLKTIPQELKDYSHNIFSTVINYRLMNKIVDIISFLEIDISH